MMKEHHSHRPGPCSAKPIGRSGVTLVELLLFVGLLAFAGVVIIDLLMLSMNSQVRQRTITDVEQNGMQIQQILSYHIRHAERILDPAAGETGSVLALQTADAAADPTIIGLKNGALTMVKRETEYALSDPDVSVRDFVVTNTSPSADRPSVLLSFVVIHTTPVLDALPYEREFTTAATLFPDDTLVGNACGCAQPHCDPPGYVYTWQVCDGGACADATAGISCSAGSTSSASQSASSVASSAAPSDSSASSSVMSAGGESSGASCSGGASSIGFGCDQ